MIQLGAAPPRPQFTRESKKSKFYDWQQTPGRISFAIWHHKRRNEYIYRTCLPPAVETRAVSIYQIETINLTLSIPSRFYKFSFFLSRHFVQLLFYSFFLILLRKNTTEILFRCLCCCCSLIGKVSIRRMTSPRGSASRKRGTHQLSFGFNLAHFEIVVWWSVIAPPLNYYSDSIIARRI